MAIPQWAFDVPFRLVVRESPARTHEACGARPDPRSTGLRAGAGEHKARAIRRCPTDIDHYFRGTSGPESRTAQYPFPRGNLHI